MYVVVNVEQNIFIDSEPFLVLASINQIYHVISIWCVFLSSFFTNCTSEILYKYRDKTWTFQCSKSCRSWFGWPKRIYVLITYFIYILAKMIKKYCLRRFNTIILSILLLIKIYFWQIQIEIIEGVCKNYAKIIQRIINRTR